MILLDTNVISEPTKLVADIRVRNWLDSQNADNLYASSTSIAEIRLGIEIIPEGQRKSKLRDETSKLIELLFGSRILAFDRAAAEAYA